MTTWSARLTDRRKRFALWFTIQGIAPVFKEVSTINCSSILGETRTELTVIPPGGIAEGTQTIDVINRGCVGGSLQVRLLEPYGSSALRTLFRSRRRKVSQASSGGFTSSATTINVSDTSFVTSFPGTIYVGAETITVGAAAVTPTRFTGCTRAKYGSRAQGQSASANNGAAIFDSPPFWVGRRVYLYASWLREDGTTTSALTQQIGTYRIDSAPAQTTGRGWTIDCGPLSDEFASAKLALNTKPVKAGPITFDAVNVDQWSIPVEDTSKFAVASSGFLSYALVKIPNSPALASGIDPRLPSTGSLYAMGQVTQVDSVNSTITIQPDPAWLTPALSTAALASASPGLVFGAPGIPAESVALIAVMNGIPSTIMLYMLASRIGDGANGVFDNLPGDVRDAAAFTTEPWRLGAGLDQSDIDTAGFSAAVPLCPWTYVLDTETSVADVMREFCYVTDSFWLASDVGKLTVAPMSDLANASTFTIDDTNRIPSIDPKIWTDESQVYATVEVDANYSPLSQRYWLRDFTVDGELLKRYESNQQTLSVAMKGVSVDLTQLAEDQPQRWRAPGAVDVHSLGEVARQWQLADGRCPLLMSVSTTFVGLGVKIGDVVVINFDSGGLYVDREGASIKGRRARVVERKRDFANAKIDFVLRIMETVVVFAPSAVVQGVTTTTLANDTVTLLTGTPDVSGTSPENDFAIGAKVRLWDVSAGTSQVLTVAALPGSHKLQFTTSISGAVEASRDWLTWSTLGTNTTITSASGQTESTLAYFMPSTGSPASGDIRRWR